MTTEEQPKEAEQEAWCLGLNGLGEAPVSHDPPKNQLLDEPDAVERLLYPRYITAVSLGRVKASTTIILRGYKNAPNKNEEINSTRCINTII